VVFFVEFAVIPEMSALRQLFFASL